VSYARAVIAGVLAMGIVLLLVAPSGDAREPERSLAAFIGLLAVIALLVDVDILRTWRGIRGKPPPPEPEPDEKES
jgi:hypothetical protein